MLQWQSSSCERARQASLTINRAGSTTGYQQRWLQIKRECQAALLLNLSFSCEPGLRNRNDHKPFQWALAGLFCQGNQSYQAAAVSAEPLMLPEQKHLLLFTACRCWAHFHSLVFGLTLTLWSQLLLFERLLPMLVHLIPWSNWSPRETALYLLLTLFFFKQQKHCKSIIIVFFFSGTVERN